MSSSLNNPSTEPSALGLLTDEQKSRLGVILDQYLMKLESGIPQDPRILLDEHPDLAAPLELYLESLTDLHGVAAGFGNLGTAVDDAGLDSNEATANQSSSNQSSSNQSSSNQSSSSQSSSSQSSHGQLASSQSVPGRVPSANSPTQIGDFVLGPEIGRGGMGVVYDARQISLDRRVALKVLPFAAVLDSKQIARFKNEAQAAAQLHHPHIVPVFAIGAERGVHYYAMQHIDGQPLDHAIEELRQNAAAGSLSEERLLADPLTDETVENAIDETVAIGILSSLNSKPNQRREFFRKVSQLGMDAADALHAAHEYGVVHRDIKPSNLILDRDGEIWITDFGLARCQNDVALTKTGDMVGTLRYMSPEQTFGQTALVDHRTDIYSLAVTLYELLTLRPAISGEDQPAVLRALDQRQTPRISRYCPDVPGDLETVILKAMSGDRDDRYTTAREFAEDLRPVTNGKSPVAKPPNVAEKLSRWARRHKRLVGVATAFCLVAVCGFAISTILIAREKSKTEKNFRRAEGLRQHAHKTVDRFGAQLAEKLAKIHGAEELRREVLSDTLKYYRKFVDEAVDDVALQDDLAMTYGKMAMLIDQIGSTEESLRYHRKSIALSQSLVESAPKSLEYRQRLGLCHNNLAITLRRAGRVTEARQAYFDAIEVQRDSLDGGTSAIAKKITSDIVLSHTNLGLLQAETGEIHGAVSSFREAIRLQEGLLKNDSANPDLLRNLAATYNNLSAGYVKSDHAKAVECFQTALAYLATAVKAAPADQKLQRMLALTHTNYGSLRSQMREFKEAATSCDRAIEIQRKLVEAAPSRKIFRRDLVVSYNNRGMLHRKTGSPAKAEQSFQLALDLHRPLLTQYPNDLDLQSKTGGVFNNLGFVLEKLKRDEDAAVAFKQAVEHQRIAFSQAPSVSDYRVYLSKHYFNYGRVLRRLGFPEQAVKATLARRELWPQDAERLISVAKEFTLADVELDANGANSEHCVKLAVETFQQAVDAGFVVPNDLNRDSTLRWLMRYEAFAKSMAAAPRGD